MKDERGSVPPTPVLEPVLEKGLPPENGPPDGLVGKEEKGSVDPPLPPRVKKSIADKTFNVKLNSCFTLFKLRL